MVCGSETKRNHNPFFPFFGLLLLFSIKRQSSSRWKLARKYSFYWDCRRQCFRTRNVLSFARCNYERDEQKKEKYRPWTTKENSARKGPEKETNEKPTSRQTGKKIESTLKKIRENQTEKSMNSPLGESSPEEIRTLVKGSRGPYAWPLHHRASRVSNKTTEVPCNNLNAGLRTLSFCLSFLHAIAFLTYLIVVFATPQRVNDWIFALSIARRAKNSDGVVIGVVAIAVSAETTLIPVVKQLLLLQNALVNPPRNGFPPKTLT